MEPPVGQGDRPERFGEAGLREVLALEQQAKAMLLDAQAEASGIVAEARGRAEKLVASMEVEAREEGEAARRESQLQIDELEGVIRSEAERLAEAWERVAEDHFEEALAFVLAAVTLDGAG